ncbi:Charged multivesicular body protein 2a, partial [Orchesella cincta]
FDFEAIAVDLKMEWLFGRRLTPKESLSNNKRALDKAVQDLDGERSALSHGAPGEEDNC